MKFKDIELIFFLLQLQGSQSAVDTVLVVFSVIDTLSYKNASKKLQIIRQDLHFDKPVFLVANKVDLARTRVVSEKGGCGIKLSLLDFKRNDRMSA